MMQFLLILCCGFWGGSCLFVCLFSRRRESYPAFIQFKKGRAQEKKSFLAAKLIHRQLLAAITAPHSTTGLPPTSTAAHLASHSLTRLWRGELEGQAGAVV